MWNLVRFWGTLHGPVTPRAYRVHGIGLACLKYAGDLALVAAATGRLWTPLDYVGSVPSVFLNAPSWLMPALVLWTLPFLWIGVTLTMRRAIDAGWTPWSLMAFFVPYLNYLLMLALCLAPSRAPHAEERRERRGDADRTLSVLMSIGAGVATGVALTTLEIRVFRDYGLALFIGTPFIMGAVTAFLYGQRHEASLAETVYLTMGLFAASMGVMFVTGGEGAVCLLMAAPLILPVGVFGARVGGAIASRSTPAKPAALAMLMIPLASLMEPSRVAHPVVHEVRSAVVIDAPPASVWPHVIAFAPITSPSAMAFRLGVAEPRSARIAGAGVGAIRYCSFSTGDFVEPITAWEPGRRLGFDVTASPPPLRELSLYRNLHPPHLDGYLRSRRGEFRLVSLADGRTRLEGSTWYELEMAPEGYWQLFSDYIIHAIHGRVLRHIKDEVERAE